RHDRLLCEGAGPRVAEQRRAFGHEHRLRDVALEECVAQVRLAAETEGAAPAARHPRDDDVIAGRDAGDAVANREHLPGALATGVELPGRIEPVLLPPWPTSRSGRSRNATPTTWRSWSRTVASTKRASSWPTRTGWSTGFASWDCRRATPSPPSFRTGRRWPRPTWQRCRPAGTWSR